jgi:catechol 2,3-dioxygenase-like lactoylglutathione lyase family enzyme
MRGRTRIDLALGSLDIVVAEPSVQPERRRTMELEDSYPVVVTDKLIECRDFYTRWFGFRVVFEATWFVYLKPSDESPHGIAFIAPDHPSQPPGPEAFDGEGILLTFQVHDAASEFDRVRRSGLFIDHPTTSTQTPAGSLSPNRR